MFDTYAYRVIQALLLACLLTLLSANDHPGATIEDFKSYFGELGHEGVLPV